MEYLWNEPIFSFNPKDYDYSLPVTIRDRIWNVSNYLIEEMDLSLLQTGQDIVSNEVSDENIVEGDNVVGFMNGNKYLVYINNNILCSSHFLVL